MSGTNLNTIRLPYRLFRNTVSSADTDLTATTKNWSTFKSVYHPQSGSSAIAIPLTENDNRAVVCFDHLNADTDTAALTIYAYRQGFPAEFVCSVDTITAGDQESDASVDANGVADARGVAATTRFFSDTIGTIIQAWIGGSSSVAEIDSGAANRVAKLTFDTYGYSFLLILFTTISSSDNVRAWISFY